MDTARETENEDFLERQRERALPCIIHAERVRGRERE